MPNRAGGVVFRLDPSGSPEFLLVQAVKAPIWVLPKGHIEKDEPDFICAVREVVEETGVIAAPCCGLPVTTYQAQDGQAVISWFLMRFVKQVKADEDRPVRWTSFPEEVLQHEDLKGLLKSARLMMRHYLR